MTMSIAEKTRIMDQANASEITLDGQPAVVRGRLLDYALIVQTGGGSPYKAQRISISWYAVKRIVGSSRSFHS